MSRVLISGYYGFGNVGDELILCALAAALAGHHVTVLSADPARTRHEQGVDAIGRNNLAAAAQALLQADLLVSGGGGLLQDATGPRSVPYYLGIIALARALRRPYMIYAQGIGPLRSGWARAGLRLLRGAAAITVRDAASAQYLQAVGVRGAEVTADASLSLPRPLRRAFPPELAAAGLTPGQRILAVAPRPAGDPTGALAAACDTLADRLSARVLLVPMQPAVDGPLCASLAAAMTRRPALLALGLPVTRYPEILAWCDAILAMRLHALILATLCRIPAVGLCYDPKVAAFLDALGLPERGLGLLASSPDMVRAVMAAYQAGPAEIEAPVRRLQSLAERNNAILHGLLANPAMARSGARARAAGGGR